MLLNPDWGVRRWLARGLLIMWCFFLFLGAYSFNLGKDEGKTSTTVVGWGLGLRSEEERAFYTEHRVGRLRNKLDDNELDRGNTTVKWSTIASLHGSLRSMRVALRPTRSHYRAVSRMLATANPARVYAVPRGNASTVARTWESFWTAIEQFRILVAISRSGSRATSAYSRAC